MKYIDWQSNKVKRIYTGTAIVAVLAIAFALRFLTHWIFDGFILAAVLVAAYEVIKAKKANKKGVAYHYVFAYVVVAYAAFVLSIVSDFPFWLHIIMQIIVLVVFAFYVYMMNYMDTATQKQSQKNNVKHSKTSLLSAVEFLKIAVYPVLMIFTLVPINHIGTFVNFDLETGEVLPVKMLSLMGLLLVIGISCFTDTFAYTVGSKLKGKKLCPKISPNKTISGAIGGLFGGVIAALLVVWICLNDATLYGYLYHKFPQVGGYFFFIFVGLFGAVINQVGDIYASWLKRKTGIKDFGNFMPGHGGMMDRMDGIMFNSVFISLVLMLVVLI